MVAALLSMGLGIGGRTYVRESGSTMLANHGTQRLESRAVSVAGVIDEISWRRPDGTLQVAEQREVSVEAFDGGWRLDLSEPVLSLALCHIDNAFWIPEVLVHCKIALFN